MYTNTKNNSISAVNGVKKFFVANSGKIVTFTKVAIKDNVTTLYNGCKAVLTASNMLSMDNVFDNLQDARAFLIVGINSRIKEYTTKLWLCVTESQTTFYHALIATELMQLATI